jgi:hypothetical protein
VTGGSILAAGRLPPGWPPRHSWLNRCGCSTRPVREPG